MTRFTDFEKAMVGRAKTPVRPAAAEGFARIAAFGRALGAHFRHATVRAQVRRDLAHLSDRMLADIGMTRGDIEVVAEFTAHQAAPVERSLTGEVGALAYDLLLRPLVRFVRRRRAYENLMALDDRMLRDIGLTRDEIPALVRSLTGDRPAWQAAPEKPAEATPALRLWNRYRATARELGQLDNQTLADIGFVRGDIDWVAEELAIRSLSRPANANRTSRAA
jgi:uncharacterized protein YjiS (DUF1127 family)